MNDRILLETFGRRIRVGMVGGGADSVIGRTHLIAMRVDGLCDLVVLLRCSSSGIAGLENAIMDRKLAAILAADGVGYTALMERDEKGTHERLKAGRKQHHGRIFKLMGDGMLAEFGSVCHRISASKSGSASI